MPKQYALASHVRHPGNVCLREADLLPAIDRWLLIIFAPLVLAAGQRPLQEPFAGSGTAGHQCRGGFWPLVSCCR